MVRFSVILPVYNVEKYIERCIKSIIGQTFDDFEIIVIDDESKDKSIEIVLEMLKDFQGKYSLITQKNKGLGGARNTGISKALGQYLVFIDSDDYIDSDYLRIVNQKIVESNADIILFDSNIVSEQGDNIGEIVYEGIEDSVFGLSQHKELLILNNAAWNKVYNKKVFLDSGILYPEKLLYEDLATTGKLLLKAKKIAYVKRKLYNYVKRENSITTTRNFSRHHEIIQAFSMLDEYFKQQGKQKEYEQELEFLAVSNLLLSQVTYINHYNYKESVQEELIDFIVENYVEFWNNYYINNLTIKKKIILYLIIKKYLWFLNVLVTNRYNIKRRNN